MESEIEKYVRAYQDPAYRMGRARLREAEAVLISLSPAGGFLDVGCGRGEVLDIAEARGFSPVVGLDACGTLAGDRVLTGMGQSLPFDNGSFSVATMFDVIEHLPPGDDEQACRELRRVATDVIVLTANNEDSWHQGEQLHINKRRYEDWDALFRKWFAGRVEWLPRRKGMRSHTWRVVMNESVVNGT